MMQRHRLDPFSLLFGLIFVGIGGTYLLGGTSVAATVIGAWPLVIIALGVAVFASLFRAPRDE